LLCVALLLVVLVVDPSPLPIFVFYLQVFDVVVEGKNLAVDGALVAVNFFLFELYVVIY
jgi:hypothetical protein